MSGTKKRWTREEDEILISNIKKYSSNLAAAFKIVAEETGRSYIAVKLRWYTKYKNSGVVFFTTVSQSNQIVNSKISNDCLEHPTTLSRVLRIIRNLFNLV